MAIATFLIGLLVGAIVTLQYMASLIRKVEAAYYGNQMVEMAVVARHIRAGRADKLLARLDAALPVAAVHFDARYRRCQDYAKNLWHVQRYYAENAGLPISAELKSVLGALPPRPANLSESSQMDRFLLLGAGGPEPES